MKTGIKCKRCGADNWKLEFNAAYCKNWIGNRHCCYHAEGNEKYMIMRSVPAAISAEKKKEINRMYERMNKARQKKNRAA